MRISPATIKRFKGEPSDLKKLFTAEKKTDGIKDLLELTSGRLQAGRTACLRDSRLYGAIDQAYETAFRQVPYTLVRGLIDRETSSETVMSAVKDWGLTHMLTDNTDSEGRVILDPHTRTPEKRLDLPTFFNIFVPVVAAYTKARWAKLYNDRDLYPLLKYDPLKLTVEDRLRCEILTDAMERKTTDFGYRSVLRQAIFQTLLYSSCYTFPSEDWHVDYGWDESTPPKKRIIKEGLRIAIPHPSRTFVDQAHRPSTFNTDTGASYGGYWDVQRYSEVMAQGKFWNTKQLSKGRLDFLGTSDWRLYQELFPCYVKYPAVSDGPSNDRLEAAFYDPVHEADAAVNVQPIFQKLVPKDWGLFDCDEPLWFRFVMANDVTPLYVSPLCYAPICAYLYDYDENRGRNASLALELLPWQDHLGNYLTQFLLSVKKNLMKAVFWNTEILSEAEITKIRNLGEKMYRETVFIPFNSRELGFQQIKGMGEAFQSVNFPQVNTQEIAACINLMITVMERMLGFSAQEVGAPAAHEQSATELNVISANTGVKVEFTGGFIDDGIAAFKRQLNDSFLAYSDDEVVAQVGELNDVRREKLNKLGWKVESETDGADNRVGVVGSKKTLEMSGFASDREGSKRIQDSKIAATMVQTFQAMFSNPMIVQSVGIKNLVGMFNQILIYAGLPSDFKLKVDEKALSPEAQQAQQQEQAKAVQEQLVQIAQKVAVEVSQQVVQKNLGELADGLKTKVFQPMGEQIAQTGQAVQQVGQAVQQTQQALQAMQQAIVELAKHSQTGEQHDGAQDQAIAKLAEIMQAAVGPAPDPAPQSMPNPNMQPMPQAAPAYPDPNAIPNG